MRAMLVLIPVLATSLQAAAITYTFTSVTGNASGLAQVPPNAPTTINTPYDFSFNPSVGYEESFPIGSQSPGGVALATPGNRLSLSRSSNAIIIFQQANATVSSTHPDGIAEASAFGRIHLEFTVTPASAGPFYMNYLVRNRSTNPGTMLSNMLFERVGDTPIVDLEFTGSNESEGDTQVFVNLIAGNYVFRADVEAIAEVEGIAPVGVDSIAEIIFGLTPVPTPASAALLALSAVTLFSRRQRHLAI